MKFSLYVRFYFSMQIPFFNARLYISPFYLHINISDLFHYIFGKKINFWYQRWQKIEFLFVSIAFFLQPWYVVPVFLPPLTLANPSVAKQNTENRKNPSQKFVESMAGNALITAVSKSTIIVSEILERFSFEQMHFGI